MNYCFFLDWNGLTPSEWAAWTQAILSGAAILAAAMIPAWQEKRTRKRRIDVYVDIIAHAENEAQATLSFIDRAARSGRGIHSNEQKEWEMMCKVFSSIPFHDVPDYKLYSLIRDAARASEVIRENYEPFLDSGFVIPERLVIIVREQTQILAHCYEEAADLSNKLGGATLRYKWQEFRRGFLKMRD